jgi:hypothetical protein
MLVAAPVIGGLAMKLRRSRQQKQAPGSMTTNQPSAVDGPPIP